MTIIRHIPQTRTETTIIRKTPSPKIEGFTFDEAALKLADAITLGDLLNCGSLDERTIAALLMLISHARTNLFHSVDKTDEEKCLQVDLMDLYRTIGQESFDEAFSKSGLREGK
jgi:hypothetical protein